MTSSDRNLVFREPFGAFIITINELIKISIIQDSADSVFPFPGYVDIGLIPEGARDISIQEVAEAGNFLALRSDNPNQYFLNGGWTIQWNGDYKAAGTVFTYERTGHLENLTSPGPTTEPLWIQVRPGRRDVLINSKHLCSPSPAPLPGAQSRRALRVHHQQKRLQQQQPPNIQLLLEVWLLD